MILVKKTGDMTTQKVISTLIKRAKKFNLVSRKRKTARWNGKISDLVVKRKAIKKMKYLKDLENNSKLAKKI